MENTDRKILRNQMVLRGMERAGLLGQMPPSSIKQGLLGEGTDRDTENALFFLDVMRLSDPDNLDIDNMTTRPGFEFRSQRMAGMKPEELSRVLDAAYKGFPGRGWSASEQSELGRTPGAHEASAGDQWVNGVRSDVGLAEKLLGGESKPTGDLWMDADLSGTGYVSPYSERVYEYQRGREDEALPYSPDSMPLEVTPEQAIGTMTDPHSLVGGAMHQLGEGPNAWITHNFSRRPDGITLDTIKSALFDSDSNENQLAKDQKRASELSNRPATLLPGDYGSWQEKEAARAGTKSLHEMISPNTYAEAKKTATGEYPSYAEESAVTLFENAVDWGTPFALATGGASGFARGGVKGAVAGAAANSAAEMATEDLPMGVVLQAGTEAATRGIPHPSQWLTTDRALVDLPDESDSEFANRVEAKNAARVAAQKELASQKTAESRTGWNRFWGGK